MSTISTPIKIVAVHTNGGSLQDAEGRHLATLSAVRPQDLATVVRAVNRYAALREALEGIYEEATFNQGLQDHPVMQGIAATAKAALAKEQP